MISFNRNEMNASGTPGIREVPAIRAISQAIGALAVGAVAIGALAVGALAIGRLAIGRARIRQLEIDELVVRCLRVTEKLQIPPAPPDAENWQPVGLKELQRKVTG